MKPQSHGGNPEGNRSIPTPIPVNLSVWEQVKNKETQSASVDLVRSGHELGDEALPVLHRHHTLVVTIVIILTGLFLMIRHRESKVAAIRMADRLFSEINAKVMERHESALESVAVLSPHACPAWPLRRWGEDCLFRV